MNTSINNHRTLGGIIALLLVSVLMLLSLPMDGAEGDVAQTIVVYGASGKIGGLIVKEALQRGHRVIGVSRNPNKLLVEHKNFTTVKGDVTDFESVKTVTSGADSVVISVSGSGAGNTPENSVHARAATTVIAVFSESKDAPYVIQMGGGTTMFGTKEAMLANLPMPAPKGSPMYGHFLGHLVALQAYRASDIDWTVITPPLQIRGWTRKGITDTQRVGVYRSSTSEHLRDAEGQSAIFVADLAAATIDELENKNFVRQRFTVGY
mgnify:CR=1 FL=1